MYALYKNPTYMHQNNPIIWELRARHGRSLNFAGGDHQPGATTTPRRTRSAPRSGRPKLARMLDADGAVLTAEGGRQLGHRPDARLPVHGAGRDQDRGPLRGGAGRRRVRLPLFYTVPEGRRRRQRRLRGRGRVHARGGAGDRGRTAAGRGDPLPRPVRSEDVLPVLRGQPAGKATCSPGGPSDDPRGSLPQPVLRGDRRGRTRRGRPPCRCTTGR